MKQRGIAVTPLQPKGPIQDGVLCDEQGESQRAIPDGLAGGKKTSWLFINFLETIVLFWANVLSSE